MTIPYAGYEPKAPRVRRRSPRTDHKPKATTAIDTIIAFHIRKVRTFNNLSQTDLANSCGITGQQIGKIESCEDRISASRLWLVAKALGVEIGYFFQDVS